MVKQLDTLIINKIVRVPLFSIIITINQLIK